MLDLMILNGTVCDGGGGPPVAVDIGVAGDRIEVVAPRGEGGRGLAGAQARETIDASGRLVTPGFVDVHSHSDFNILIDPNGESKVRQGITTEIVGNCGMSAFPLKPVLRHEEWEIRPRRGLDLDWDTAEGYFARLEAARPAFNLATFVGHGNVRGAVMGFEDRPPTADELRAMLREVEAALDAGALGMSTGLIYAPGMFADTAELVELQRAAAARGGIYASHVRGEGDHLLESADEFVRVVEETGSRAQYSHLKASGRRNSGKARRVLEQLEEINDRHGFVRFDKYPYTASSTELATLLPRWARDGGGEAAAARMRDPALRARAVGALREDYADHDPWGGVLLVDAACHEFRPCEGKSLRDIAGLTGMPPEDACVEILAASRFAATICNFTMSQEETDMAILHRHGMVCSDGECRCTSGILAEGAPHPRSYGAFGKFFRDYVKERPLLSLEAAVAKVTALPCEVFGFARRGRIAEGWFADLLVLDWDRYEDRASYAAPHQYCEGVEAVVVNGVLEVRGGAHTGNRGGRVLRQS
jgi:N-acyl-D-amino-acid deacylase